MSGSCERERNERKFFSSLGDFFFFNFSQPTKKKQKTKKVEETVEGDKFQEITDLSTSGRHSILVLCHLSSFSFCFFSRRWLCGNRCSSAALSTDRS